MKYISILFSIFAACHHPQPRPNIIYGGIYHLTQPYSVDTGVPTFGRLYPLTARDTSNMLAPYAVDTVSSFTIDSNHNVTVEYGNGISEPLGSFVGKGFFIRINEHLDSATIAATWLLHHHRDFIYNIDHIEVYSGWGKVIKVEHPEFLIRLGDRFYYPNGKTRARIKNIYYLNEDK